MSEATKDGTEAPRGERVQDAFAEAAAMPTLARMAFLARLRSESGSLADEVESLLAYHARGGAIDPPTLSLPGSLVGETIAGCHLEELIGFGGMSAVYAATQRFPRRRVAVKLVRPERLSESASRRLRVEAEALARLEHPNIARVYAAGVERIGSGETQLDSPYIVMEIIEGATPLTRWADGRNLGARARLELVAQIADAVAHAHGAGVIHRDLKPGNVVVGREGVPKVIDFGIAAVADSHVTAATEGPMGTLAYMSPEQARGIAVDARSDVWGLGALLYDLLAGEPPFDANDRSLAAHIDRLLNDVPEPVAARAAAHRGPGFAAEIPPATDAVLRRALANDPARRYQSAAQFAEELRHLVAGEPLLARPDSEWDAVARLYRRNRPALIAAAGIFAATLAALVVSLTLLRSEREAHGRAEWAAYAASIAAASGMIERGDASAASDMLASAPETHRGWEWSALARRTSQSRARVEFPVREQVYGLSYSPDGDRLAIAASSYFGLADARSGRVIWRVRHHLTGPAWRIFELPDGAFVACILDNTPLRISADGVVEARGTVTDVVDAAATADRSRIFLNGVEGAREIDPKTLAVIREIVVDPPFAAYSRAIAVSPDGALLASGDMSGETIVFDAETGASLVRTRVEAPVVEIRGVAFSPDGRRVAWCGGGNLGVLDLDAAAPLWHRRDATGGYRTPRFTPDGSEVVVADYSELVRRFDAATGEPIAQLVGAHAQVWCAEVSPDGGTIAAGSFNARVDLFDAGDSSVPRAWTLDGSEVRSISARRRILAATERGALYEVDPASGDARRIEVGSPVSAVAELSDGRVVVCTDDGVAFLASDGAAARRIALGAKALRAHPLDAERTLAVLLEDGRQVALDIETGDTRWTTQDCKPQVRPACETGQDGVYLILRGQGVSSTYDTPATGRSLIMDGQLEYSMCAALSPDRTVLAIGSINSSAELSLYDARTLAPIAYLANHRGLVRDLAWSADGSRIATVGADDTVRIWHPKRAVEMLVAWRGTCLDLDWSPDGTLWLAGADGRVRAIGTR